MKTYPQAYDPWLKALLPEVPSETLATCDQCAMVNPSGITRDPGPFLNHLKCCTYFPYLPNFSLGALTPEELNKAESRGIYLPVGLYPSMAEQDKISSFGAVGFGKRSELLCPFFDGVKNQCSIWAYRPGVCTSYFCKSTRGQQGLDFWKQVEDYLNQFEWTLACRVLETMNFDENTLSYCQAAMSEEIEPEERDFFIHEAWGEWISKKHEFYKDARKIALQITADELKIEPFAKSDRI